MTRIEAIDEAINLAQGNEELVEKLEGIRKSLAKKSTGKPTKKQVENEGLKEQIAQILTNADEPMTATAIGAECRDAEGKPLKFQRVGSLLKQMDNVVKSYTSKGDAVFALADAE